MEGIITPIVTPFYRNKEQSINYEATKQLINHLITHGVNGIFILGSNGEFHVIDEEEKIELQLLNSIRNSSNQTAAMKIATSIILYALEHPQSFRQQFRDLPME